MIKVLFTKDEEDKLKRIILTWKKKGSKFVYTRHNIKPHSHIYQDSGSELYDIVEENSDCIVHMEKWSKNEFITNNPIQTQHIIIPHHI